jgi:serine/threonine protein kinase
MTTSPPRTGLPERIGRYRVETRIGKGAMGTVYAALDEQLGRRVAVKLMLAAFDEDPELRERFFREARITGQLLHRNIVTMYDLGEDNGRPFIVMELLDGLPLQEYLRTDAAATLDAKIDLMMQICDGLQIAHAAGVVHRDIKPSNLMVMRDGTLKVLDFGVARLSSSNLTAHGMLLGTPEYMSPEQARGAKMGAPADVFSAAGVFYFMLAGRPPFGSQGLQKVLHAIIHDSPAPLTMDEAPEALWRVLAKGLAKTPEQRYLQCADMRADLEVVRRSVAATTQRTTQAARDRYKQILGLIEQRRALGQLLGIPDIDASCDEARERLEGRFQALVADEHIVHPIDRAVASAALEALQLSHNAEQAALAALRERAGSASRSPGPDAAPDRSRSFWRDLLRPRDN